MHDARRAADAEATGVADAAGSAAPHRRRWAREWIKSFLIAFGLFLFIRTFLVEAFRIPTGSMENTLLVGDFLLVNKAIFGARVPFTRVRTPAPAEPARGDIVIFTPPHDPGRTYVKRLIGVAGDTLSMAEGILHVNGVPANEPYVRQDQTPDVYAPGMFWQCDHAPAGVPAESCRPTRDNWGPIIVPDERYFLMGDNRHDSEDSRYWGFVPRTELRGRPLFIYYSFDPRATGALPWLTSIRWSRIGDRVH